ncbi:50S ribosomal protein L17 [Candidatus Daviesbacteria bacterium RIFCSPHIGHO2_01_FULL_44_29]|uniref:50S ribosomal protein L17 n=1 Tax=Candidatus Daviesbacteria bacterium RIFCSPHIGHO2_02_FULL_43_12 TaxID=1797776 RepID=A0A1F5KG59_9BACT|nr:MAG: 50S ribosomal protein L17 [Candidatus Daviesbacteria bacterium RIFCSPHIGHO2_01_FULL_44_29]OGE39932.1 MAG: 50S ribosomal protein L17 [Candidatus Daviesbacteria bacterium RIFCSPHIGHO2_02_FULL_43_12]OGE40510.1 MAG: 50S ribosomal protein L17 [Candidatus Daviesbacteria bacterium RIFCSPHIGHO2_12_FULL_47_45]OGE70387.1 MAG: 50S ribosomal protein L17 [Candidatus Daviesbacteria bacterium RIFCSPLOWO2_01_FULL_43_15]
MRHSIYGKKLSRDTNQRTALFKALVSSLILSEKIQTTQAKAAAIKGLVDRLITQAKSPTTKRLVAQFLTRKEVYEKLINDLTPRMKDRNSGYTSVVKLGYRQGDGALMVQMSLLLGSSDKGQETSKSKQDTKTEKLEAAQELPKQKEVKTQKAKVKSASKKAKV